MAGSLLDFGQVLNTAVNLQNLEQNQQRLEIQRQNNEIQKQELAQRERFKQADTLEKLVNDPKMALNKPFQTRARLMQGALLGLPMPSESEMRGAIDEYGNLVTSVLSGDQEAGQTSFYKLAAASPKLAGEMIADLEKIQTLPLKLQELKQKLEVNQAHLAYYNEKAGKLKFQDDVYTANLAELSRAVNLYEEPAFKPHLTKLFGMDDVKRQAYLALNPEFKQAFEQRLALETKANDHARQILGDQLSSKEESLGQLQLVSETGQAPKELEDEVRGYKISYLARQLEGQLLNDPYNKDLYKKVGAAKQNMSILQGETKKQLSTLADERLALMQAKNDDKKAMESAVNKGQVAYAALPIAKQTSQAAASIAREVFKETGVLPSTEDIRKGAKDPNRPSIEVKNVLAQETEEAKKVGGGYGERFNKIQDAAFSASDTINKLDRMEQLMQGVQTGALEPTFAELNAIGESIGLKLDPKLGAKQAMEALTNKMALDLRSTADGGGMPGALSDADRAFLRAMPPGLSRTPEGNKLLIETSRKLAERSMEVADMAAEYRDRKGHFDAGFLKELRKWANEHPLFDPADTPVVQAPALPNAYSDPDKERRYQEWKSKQ